MENTIILSELNRKYGSWNCAVYVMGWTYYNLPFVTAFFQVLQTAAEGVAADCRNMVNFAELASPDYDPYISLDNVRDGGPFHLPQEFPEYIFDDG